MKNEKMNNNRFFDPFNVDSIAQIATKELFQTIISGYQLPVLGIHGISHWARVLENGVRLSAVNGANIKIVILFALFHDSKRRNEAKDDGHGQRGAAFITEIKDHDLALSNTESTLLQRACELHTDGLTEGDVTLQTCWDSDRLDLNRVGIRTDPEQLCTEMAKDPEVMDWAMDRAEKLIVPGFVHSLWNIA